MMKLQHNRDTVVVVGKLLHPTSPDQIIGDNISSALEYQPDLGDKGLFGLFYNEVVFIFQSTEEKELIRKLQSIHSDLLSRYHLVFLFGVSRSFSDLNQCKQAYREAKLAIDWIRLSDYASICFYEDMKLGLLLTAITSQQSTEFVDSVLSDLTEEDKKLYSNILHQYTIHNGSIKSCSEALYIHKNTLQYQLNRLHKITGYNPRVLSDFVILYLAFKLY